MRFLILFLWLIIVSKKLSFWVWLWQLKEYHIGRFLAHFQTRKGKELIIHPLLLAKLFLLPGLLFYWPVFFSLLVLVYGLETLFTFRHLLKKTFKFPVLTKKTLFLLFFGFCLIVFLFGSFWKTPLFKFTIFLLIVDILAPVIFSGLILLFQPLTFFWQRIIIQKARKKREKFKDLISIGITGSYGKTSTKEFLAEILSSKYKVLKTKEHQNSEVGISLCILNELKPEHQVFVCEMGAYQKGGIKLLASIAKPNIGILTGINEQHMATFGSQENIIKTKYELIEGLPKGGLAIFNGNNKFCRELYNRRSDLRKLEVGPQKVNKLDIWAEDIEVKKEFISFKVFVRDGEWADFKLNLIGAQNVENILLAACCAKELGMSLKEIARTCEKIKPQEKTMKLKRGIAGITIIDDSYSANPQGVISALDYLKIYSGKKIIIMPCLIELGPASREVHKRIGKKIGEVCDLAIITNKDRFKEIKDGSTGSPRGRAKVLFIENPKKIIKKIQNFCTSDDIILLEGRIPRLW